MSVTVEPGHARPDQPLPPGVHGTVQPGYEAVAVTFGKSFNDRERGGGALTLQVRGRTVVDIWAGWSDRARTRAWTPDTSAMSFSTTKGIASTVMHRLADRGLLDYDAPVAEYWPEFAARNKAAITIRELMSHQAGLYDARSLIRRPEDLLDHLTLEDKLAAARAYPRPGFPNYHGLTYGWLLAGVARRITGRGMAELFRTEIAEPLGITGVALGAPTTGDPAAEFVGSLKLLGASAVQLLLPVGAYRRTPTGRLIKALLPIGMLTLFEGDEPAVLQTELPAANGVFTARALATVYSALANGESVHGVRLLSPDTITAAGRVQVRRRDGVLGIPMGWRVGYHHALSTWRRSRRGFGHYGLGGSGGFADPTSGLSFGFVTNRIDVGNIALGNVTTLRLADVALRSAARDPAETA